MNQQVLINKRELVVSQTLVAQMASRAIGRLLCLGAICLALVAPAAFAKYSDLSKAPAGEYTLDKTHGYITFSYLHQGYSRPWLRFRDIDATLTIDDKDINQSSVVVEIDAASIDSGVDIFDEHLVGDKHFHVEKYPKINFKSVSLKTDGKTFTMLGELTMKGTTKSVELEGTFNKGGNHFKTKKPILGFSATASLKRSDWGLGSYVPMVGDKVDVVIEMEFVQP